jgi:hypothetical protein
VKTMAFQFLLDYFGNLRDPRFPPMQSVREIMTTSTTPTTLTTLTTPTTLTTREAPRHEPQDSELQPAFSDNHHGPNSPAYQISNQRSAISN